MVSLPVLMGYTTMGAAFGILLPYRFVGVLRIGCRAVFALVPMPFCIALPPARKIMGKQGNLFSFHSFTVGTRESPFTLFRAGSLFSHHSFAPFMFGNIHLFRTIFVRGAGVPMI